MHMISTSDCGNRFDIHPKNKQPIGIRMALSARQHVYEEAVQGDAPVAVEMKYRISRYVFDLTMLSACIWKGKNFRNWRYIQVKKSVRLPDGV